MKTALNLVTLGVDNLDAMRAFYENVFGWEPLPQEGITMYQLGGLILSLYPRHELAEDAQVAPEGSGFKAFTLAILLGSEAEVDAAFAEVKAKGGRITKEAQKAFWGGYSGYISDPEGNLWEVAYNPFL